MKNKINAIDVRTFEIFGRGASVVTISSFRRAQRAQLAIMQMGKGDSE